MSETTNTGEMENERNLQEAERRQPVILDSLQVRQAKIRRFGEVMLLIMAIAMLLTGAIGSIKWDNALTQTFYSNPEQRFASAALNVSTGLLFAIAMIGVYLSEPWGVKLNLIACAWYLVGATLVEIWEADKITWTESIADLMFWGSFPIIQVACIVIGSKKLIKTEA
jgi:hypothetical protein